MRTMIATGVFLMAAACSSGGSGTSAPQGSSSKPVAGGGSSSSDTGASSKGSPASRGGSIDPALVGEWYAGRGGTMMSYDATTGQLGPASGTGMLFVFKADGSYVKAVQSIEDGPCTMGYVSTESGALNESDSELLLHPTHGNLHTISCSHVADTDKPLDVRDDTLTWSLAPYSQDPSTPGLTLTNGSGATAEFRKTK